MKTPACLKPSSSAPLELAAVNTVSSALVSELNLDALINLVGERTRAIFNADIAYVALLDESHGLITFPYTYGEDLTTIRDGEGLTSIILQTNRPLLINQELDQQLVEIGATLVGRPSAVLPGRADRGQRQGGGCAQRAEHHA